MIGSHFFDGIFGDGAFTEARIEEAGVRIMELAQQNRQEAEVAQRMLANMFIVALANGLVVNPEGCASHYMTIMRAASGQPTLLDQVKQRFTAE